MKEKDEMTIKEAKDQMRPLLRTGCTCPACGQPVRLYRRPLTSSMVYGLIVLFKASRYEGPQCPEIEWIHLEESFKVLDVPASVRGDVPKLRYWNLLEPKTGSKTDENPNNGYYKITDTGKAFVENRIKVQSHINLYNNKFYGFPKDSKKISIIEALKNKFNYSEIVK